MKWIKWEVWLVRIKYEGLDKIHEEPCVIIGSQGDKIILFRVTKNLQKFERGYTLRQYARAGLYLNTTIILSQKHEVLEKQLIHKKGTIAGTDIISLQKYI